MKKLFRFQYEACNGTCYAPEEQFFIDLRAVPLSQLHGVVDKIVTAHNRTCNNPNMRFAVDLDETHNIYIGSWMNNGTLDLFSSSSFIDVVDQLSSHILDVVPEAQTEYDNNCEFGEGHENLAEMILNAVA